jgi:hypothetical protein
MLIGIFTDEIKFSLVFYQANFPCMIYASDMRYHSSSCRFGDALNGRFDESNGRNYFY